MKRFFQIGFPLLVLAFTLFGCAEMEVSPYAPQEELEREWTPTPFELELAANLPRPRNFADNPFTVEGVRLGRMLFYDPILSEDSTQSCGSCHGQSFGFTDFGNKFSTGIDGIEGSRNSMAIINLIYGEEFFWDGRTVGLENQAGEPVENPIEMHDEWPNVEAKLNRHATYPDLFFEAFGSEECTKENATKALAQFMRTLISGNSRYDKAIRFEGPYTPEERAGEELFMSERGDCFHCHAPPHFTDFSYRNNGIDSLPNDYGREMVTGQENDRGYFKVPTLRNVATTAPYMHDGRFQTLEEVIDHYNEGVHASPYLSPVMNHDTLRGLKLELTEEEKSNLLAFLHSLTDSTFLTDTAYANPFQ